MKGNWKDPETWEVVNKFKDAKQSILAERW